MVRSFDGAEWAAVLAGGVIASLMLFTGLLQSVALPLSALLALVMVMWIAIRDLREFIIPDGPTVCIALVGAAIRLMTAGDFWLEELAYVALDGVLCGGALLAVREIYYRLRGYDGIGFGDVKLAAAGGILVGMAGFAWAVFAASAGGLLIVVAVMIVRRSQPIDRLPFGALLAPACWLIWFVGLLGAP